MQATLKFITWPAIAGLLAALLILDRWVFPAQPDESVQHVATASYNSAVTRATPAVVNIYTAKLVNSSVTPLFQERFRRNPRPRIERSLGSGVIISEQGHILTNLHVIAGADAIWVLLHDGRTANALVIGSDSATDLAVLKVDLPDLVPAELADSDQLRVGDVVLAIGNPLGFGHSVTQGIVSGLGRWGLQPNTFEDYIQTDATIHQGNSGGALVDAEGRLVGINTLIYTTNNQSSGTGIGISLALPSNLALYVMKDLIEYGEVIRGWLGVSVEPVRLAGDNQQQALLVIGVAEGSPAERADIQPGDVITHINGSQVIDGRLTMHKIARLRPGEPVRVTVQRNQQSLELQAVVGAQGQNSPAA